MIKRCLTLVVVAVFVLGFGATMVARNMGFRLTVALDGPGTNLSGTNLLNLPYQQRTDLLNAQDLLRRHRKYGGQRPEVRQQRRRDHDLRRILGDRVRVDAGRGLPGAGGLGYELRRGRDPRSGADRHARRSGARDGHQPLWTAVPHGNRDGRTTCSTRSTPRRAAASFWGSADSLAPVTPWPPIHCPRSTSISNPAPGISSQVTTDVMFVPAHY